MTDNHKDLLKQLVEAPYGTEDYRQAPSGNGPLASEWEDKPHRLVYDLCSKVEALLAENSRLKEAEALLIKYASCEQPDELMRWHDKALSFAAVIEQMEPTQ